MTHNSVTGDRIATKPASDAYRDNYEGIFGVRKRVQYDPPSQCGDCGGTRKVDGRPCPICCPADDGPGKDEG